MSSIRYRPEIDGLRAVAVVPVILFHADITGFDGGFVGVDIFFVISGYLITSIIHAEVLEQRFSIANFYERRARRILPALFAVCACSTLMAWLWMFPEEFDRFGQSLAAVGVFASNVLFWHQTGYFDTAAELKPLLHTWSLAVEEQYYVLFPLVLLALRRLTSKHLAFVIAAIGLFSLALSQWTAYTHPSAGFFFLLTRAWELAAGALIAIAVPDPGRFSTRMTANAGSALGLVLIAYSIFYFDSTTPFPSLWAVAPVLGCTLIIVFAQPGTLVGRFLMTKPLVGIGLISYSAYLWHQPLLAFLRIRSLSDPSMSLRLLVGVVSLGVAYLSWRYIERPFRNPLRVSRRAIFSYAAAMSAGLFIFGCILHVADGFPGRIDKKAQVFLQWSEEGHAMINTRYDQCVSKPGYFIQAADTCVWGDQAKASVAIWGDSHAAAIADELAHSLNKNGVALRQMTYSGCLPILGYRSSDPDFQACTDFNRNVSDFIKTHDGIRTVILSGRFTYKLVGGPFDNHEGGVELGPSKYALPADAPLSFIQSPQRVDAVGKLIRNTVDQLVAAGKNVVIVYPEPEAGWNVPTLMAKRAEYEPGNNTLISTSYRVFRRRNAITYKQFDRIPDNPQLLRIYPASVFCNAELKGRCILEKEGQSLYADDDHLSPAGSRMLVDSILSGMQARGWLHRSNRRTGARRARRLTGVVRSRS